MKNQTKPIPYTDLDPSISMQNPNLNAVKTKLRSPIDNMVVAPTSS